VGELATPCIGDDGVSLSFAASQQDIGLKVADSAEANSTSLTDVCSAVDASGVVLVYASGVRLAESPNGSADPKTAWQALVDQYPDAGYELTTFDGQPALQIPAGGPLDSPGAVMWVEEGVKYLITGNGKMPVADLWDVAASLVPYAAATPDPSGTPAAS
jgi:hypothetical protein